MKKVRMLLSALLILFVLFTAFSCAAGPNPLTGTTGEEEKPAGFWMGLWHGFIVLFTFIISLFTDKVSVYEVHNKGHLYDLGFLLGIMIFFGGSGGASRSKKRYRDND